MLCKLPTRHDGFTLIELLIALFIFTIVAMIATGALRSVIRAERSTEKSAERLRELQTAFLIMSHDISQAVDRPIINSIGKEQPAFQGSPSGFEFTHLSIDPPLIDIRQSALEHSAFYWRNGRLMRLLWTVVDQPPKSESLNYALISAVSDARFEYLDSQGRFHDQWPIDSDQDRSVPRAVRVSLVLPHWGGITQTFVVTADAKKVSAKQNHAQEDNAKKSEEDERDNNLDEDEDKTNVAKDLEEAMGDDSDEDGPLADSKESTRKSADNGDDRA